MEFICSAYIAVPIFCLFFVGWRYYDGRGTIPLDRVDLVAIAREIEENLEYIKQKRLKGPKSRWRRIWDSL